MVLDKLTVEEGEKYPSDYDCWCCRIVGPKPQVVRNYLRGKITLAEVAGQNFMSHIFGYFSKVGRDWR